MFVTDGAKSETAMFILAYTIKQHLKKWKACMNLNNMIKGALFYFKGGIHLHALSSFKESTFWQHVMPPRQALAWKGLCTLQH